MAKSIISKIGYHIETWCMFYAIGFMLVVFGYEIYYQWFR